MRSEAFGRERAGNGEIIFDEEEAVRRALDRSCPGDLVVLCADHARRVPIDGPPPARNEPVS